MSALAFISALLTGNIIYQMFFSPEDDYGHAISLTFHQASAIGIYKFLEVL